MFSMKRNSFIVFNTYLWSQYVYWANTFAHLKTKKVIKTLNFKTEVLILNFLKGNNIFKKFFF